MDHVNKTLILSLKQDILVLNETIDNINTEADIRSWLFPTKHYKFVRDFIEANGIFEDDNVKLYLELVIDRLYVGLRLILSHLDSYVTNKASRKNPFLERPQQITIGCCFNSLWKLVGKLFIGMSEIDSSTATTKSNLQKNFTTVKVNVESQTDLSSLNKCDSCASAMMCMKNLLAVFENESADGMFFRRKIRPKIFDITQFGCMLQTTTTIEKSLNILFEKLFKKDQENEELRSKSEELKSENAKKSAKIAQLEQEVKLYKEKQERDLTKIRLLRDQQENLFTAKSKNDKQIEELKHILTNMKKSLSAHKMKIQSMTTERERLITFFESMWNLEKKLIAESNILQKNMLNIERKQCYLESGFRQIHDTVDVLNKKLTGISKSHTATETRIQNISSDLSDITNKSSTILDNLGEYKENIKRKLIENCVKDVDPLQIRPKFQIKGNPLEDIARQIEENNEKIRQLNNENTKLESIVSKFRCVKK